MIKPPKSLIEILQQLPRSYLVGGCVRDMLLEREPKDFDVEVFGESYQKLATFLRNFGQCDIVGKQFGVIKLTTASE